MIIEWLNSGFVSSITGAFAGAGSAYFIGIRSEDKRRKLENLTATNSAIALVDRLTEHSLGLMDQMARPLASQFLSDREQLIAKLKSGEGGPVHAEYRFGKLNAFSFPTEACEKLIFQDASLDKPTIKAAGAMLQSFNSLSALIDDYADSATRLEAMKASLDEPAFACRYFGVKNGSIRDEIHYTTITGLAEALDAIVWFGLFVVLPRMVDSAATSSKSLGKAAPKAYTVDYSKMKDKTFLPADTGFQDWMNFKDTKLAN